MLLENGFDFRSGDAVALVLDGVHGAVHEIEIPVGIGIAVLIGVPLGILLTRRPALSKPILGFANIMQTVPSLALFGFLIPLNIYLFQFKLFGGIGARTALVALARIGNEARGAVPELEKLKAKVMTASEK